MGFESIEAMKEVRFKILCRLNKITIKVSRFIEVEVMWLIKIEVSTYMWDLSFGSIEVMKELRFKNLCRLNKITIEILRCIEVEVMWLPKLLNGILKKALDD